MLASSNNVCELAECDACSGHAVHASSCDSDVSCPLSGESDERERNFDCNICVQICQEPVVTMCGHLFCWPCLNDWLSLHSASSKACPVCKADVQDKIVPLYGCGRVAPPAEGIHIPCRPSAIAHSTTGRSEPHHAMLPQVNRGFLGRYRQGTASLLPRRRRFNNEKEFVIHWVFIIVASVTIPFLLAC